MDYSKIPQSALKGVSVKDKKVIADNPQSDISTLAEKGLSAKGEKILSDIASNVKKPDVSRTAIIPKVTRMTPPASAAVQGKSPNRNQVRFRNKMGNVVNLRRKSAEYLQQIKQGKIL